MNENVNVIIKTRDETQTGFRKAGTATQNFAKTVGSAMLSLKSVLGGIALGAFFRKSISAFAEEEQAITELDQSLRNLGDTSKESRRRAAEFASEIQNVSVYGDETIIQLQALGVNLGKLRGGQLEKATKAAIGFSRAFKIDVKSAMLLIAKAAQGNTATLSRYGIVLGDNLTPQEKFNKLLLLGEGHFREMTTGIKTFTEEMKMLKNATGDTMEKFGAMITGFGKDETGYKWVRKMTDGFTDLNSRLDAFIDLKEKNADLDKRLAGTVAPGGSGSVIKNIGLSFLGFGYAGKMREGLIGGITDWMLGGYEQKYNQRQTEAARYEIPKIWQKQERDRAALKPMNIPIRIPMKFLQSLPEKLISGLGTGMSFIQKQIEFGKSLPKQTPGLPGFKPNLEFQESRFLTLGRGNRNKTEENTAIMVREARQQTRLLASLDRKAGRGTTTTTTPQLLEAKLA